MMGWFRSGLVGWVRSGSGWTPLMLLENFGFYLYIQSFLIFFIIKKKRKEKKKIKIKFNKYVKIIIK